MKLNMVMAGLALALAMATLLALTSASSPKAPKSTALGSLGGEADGREGANATTPPPSKCARFCGHGHCDEESGECICDPGWRGDGCHQCGGKVRLNATRGWLADAVGNYSVTAKCTWLVEAPNEGDTIRLHLRDFATECGWDHLYVFDGDSVFSELRAVFSGMVRGPDGYSVHKVPELVGKSGSVLLHFYSDVAYNMTGFNVTFSTNDCPSVRHDLTCSGHGSCERDTGRCRCDEDFVGEACDRPACPNQCRDREGNARGQCSAQEKRCICFAGWTGESCSQSLNHGHWRVLSRNVDSGGVVDDDQSSATPRTSHSSMLDEFGKMWVVGGETFSPKTRHMVATYALPKGEDNAGSVGEWREVHAKSDKGPSSRYGHSSVIHDRKIYMYGGTMRSGHTSREVWSLDLDLLSWSRVDVKVGQCMDDAYDVYGDADSSHGQGGPGSGGQVRSGRHKLCGPLHSMGHTANVIASRMIVIFGHSPKYGYLNTVQEYHFGKELVL